MFKKILIANRGEIAVRVMRACRELGIASVAVYSECDRTALHVLCADEAVGIGPAPAVDSYLNMDRIVDAARETGAEAIHPGYGFLAENAAFSRRCRDAGLVFIGPGPEAMELVGDKVRARRTMEEAAVPIIPGMAGVPSDPAEYAAEAERLGYPVMIKASAGGGGKGMRIVDGPDQLAAALEAGRREAAAAFGDDSVYLEKYIREPRHVEFQVLADRHGGMVHLFERECSIQRRHQKIVEESPSTAIDEGLRKGMGETACRVMRAAGYTNAGTVEFLLDGEGNYYFLEVNARIQVEHPVTELVTGVDLVHQQLLIASGEKLRLRQENLRQRGHALECRIYAEDPRRDFLPSSGKIIRLREPAGPGVRHDGGIYAGCEVPIFYDPILAKLIVWGEDRDTACRRMLRALSDYHIVGIQTGIDFLKAVIRHPDFRSGRTSTAFIARNFPEWKGEPIPEDLLIPALAAAAFDLRNPDRPAESDFAGKREEIPSPWSRIGNWSIGGEE